MRITLFFILGCLMSNVFGQTQSLTLEDTLSNDSIILLYDTLPEFEYFNVSNIKSHNSRIASYKEPSNFDYQFFIISLLFSIVLTVLIVVFKSLIKSTFKSVVDANFSYQYIRIQKNNNVLSYLLFTVLFALTMSIYIYYGFKTEIYYTYTFIIVVSFLLYDVMSNYVFMLFSKKNIKDHLLYSTLSYNIVSTIFLWPFFLLLHVNLPLVSNSSFVAYLIILLVISLLKLLRVLNVLSQEKVKINSFHFFIYLCTFKIAPILILISILF